MEALPTARGRPLRPAGCPQKWRCAALRHTCTESEIAALADPRSRPERLFSVAFDVCEVTTTTVEATTSAVELEAHFPKLGGLRAELRTTPLDTACVFDCACAGLCALI